MNRRSFLQSTSAGIGAGVAAAICGHAGRFMPHNSTMFLGYDVSRLAATPGEVVKVVNGLLEATYDKVGVACVNGFPNSLVHKKNAANFTVPNGAATWTELQCRLTKLEKHIRSNFAVDEKNQAVYTYLARNADDVYAVERLIQRGVMSA